MTENLNNTLQPMMLGPVCEGNVPGPPEVRFEGVPTASSDSLPREISEDYLTEPMFSDRRLSSPTTFGRSQYTTASPSPVQESSGLPSSEATTLEALRGIIDELEQRFQALSRPQFDYGKASDSRQSSSPAADQSTQSHEAAFLAVARRLVAYLQIPTARRVLAQAIGSRNPRSASVDRSESLLSKPESLLDRYYDAAGDVKIFGERLVEFDYAYTEQATLRLHLQDQGHEMDTSDEAFGRDYLDQRAKLEHELNRAIEKADALKTSCQLVGLDPDSQAKAADDSDEESSIVLVNANDQRVKNTDTNLLFHLYGFPSATRLEASTGNLDSGSTPHGGTPFEHDRSGPDVERWIHALPNSGHDVPMDFIDDVDLELEPYSIPLPASEAESLNDKDHVGSRRRAFSTIQSTSFRDATTSLSPYYPERMFHSDPLLGHATQARPEYDSPTTKGPSLQRPILAQPKRYSHPLLSRSRSVLAPPPTMTDTPAAWESGFSP